MNKKIILLSALALSMSLSQATLASDTAMTDVVGSRYEKMADKLELTSDQKAQIKANSTKAKEQMKPKFQEMRANHMELSQLADAKDLDETKIDKLIDQNKEIIGSLMKMRVTVRHDISMLLTEKQKMKLDGMVSDWKAKHMTQD